MAVIETQLEFTTRRRLAAQLQRVLDYTLGTGWHTLRQIADACHCSEPSASARLRQTRGMGYTVDRKKDETIEGLNWYEVRE